MLIIIKISPHTPENHPSQATGEYAFWSPGILETPKPAEKKNVS